MKSQIPSSKSQTNLKIQIPKRSQLTTRLGVDYWDLELPWDLEVGSLGFSLWR